MKLIEFIRNNHAAIIKDWEAFASSLRPAAEAMSNAALRDHADEILAAIVADMEKPQDHVEQAEKSRGQGEKHRMEAVGRIHADLRVEGGFKLDQLVAEYRALRGSILRLWGAAGGKAGVSDLIDVTRFNEALDEALAEATTWYSATIEKTRDQFLAILGHDLRSPLSGIMMAADRMKRSAGIDDPHVKAASRIMSSAGRMERMVKDLLDLTRTRLGAGIPIARTAMDLDPLLRDVLAEFEASHPDRELRSEVTGDLHGDWDHDRLAQVISNLVGNALQHGVEKTPVRVLVRGLEKDVVVEINNEGPPIPHSDLTTLFDAMVRHSKNDKDSTSLGLGLYIAREIVNAHGGTIAVTSTKQDGTTFTIRLPRHAAAPQSAQANAPLGRGETRP